MRTNAAHSHYCASEIIAFPDIWFAYKRRSKCRPRSLAPSSWKDAIQRHISIRELYSENQIIPANRTPRFTIHPGGPQQILPARGIRQQVSFWCRRWLHFQGWSRNIFRGLPFGPSVHFGASSNQVSLSAILSCPESQTSLSTTITCH